MDLYLVRHPAPDLPPGVCYGQSDVPLREPSLLLEQAQRLVEQLPEAFTLFSSPLRRALDLAQQLGNPKIEDRLREMNFGAWELQPFEDIPRAAIDAWARDPLGFRPPQGENGHDVLARILQFQRECIDGSARPCVVVGHQGPFGLWAAQLLGMPPVHRDRLHFEYAKLCHLRIESPQHVRLQRFNA